MSRLSPSPPVIRSLYQGNSETQSIAVSENQTVQILIPGSSIFTGSSTNVFNSLRDLFTALEGNDRNGIQTGLGNLDLATAQISDAQGTVGALGNRLQITHDALDTANLTISKVHFGQPGCRSCHRDHPAPSAGSRRAGLQRGIQQNIRHVFAQLPPLICLKFNFIRTDKAMYSYPRAKEGLHAGVIPTPRRRRHYRSGCPHCGARYQGRAGEAGNRGAAKCGGAPRRSPCEN